MPQRDVEQSSTTGGLPVSVSLGPTLVAADVPAQPPLVDKRVILISAIAIVVAAIAALVAQALMHLIWGVTNFVFYGKPSFAYATPPDHPHAWMIFIPIVGGLIVGLMARYGHSAIRGHGIP